MSVAPLAGIQPIIMSRPQVGIERLPSRRLNSEPREAMNCKSCRKRKIKCNRLRPSCEACQVFQCPCVYDAVPKKRGPKTDVLEALLKRVDGLEAQLKDKKGDASPDTGTPSESGTVVPESPTEPKAKRIALDITRSTETDTESALCSPSVISEPSSGIRTDALLETYFSRFHAKPYYILDESSVRQRLQVNQLPDYLTHAIYAVAARHAPNPTGYQSAVKLSEDYASRSRNEIDIDEPSVDALQALLLLVTAFTAGGKGKKAYMLLISAVGMAMALELHREVDLEARITSVEREVRRRLFWTCYLLDRFMACGSKRPCLISDKTILLRLPCWSPGPSALPVEGDFFQNGSNLQQMQGSGRKSQGSSGMLIDITRILGTTNRYLAAGGVKGDSHFPWHALSELSKIRQDLDVWASGTDDVFSSVDTLFGQPDSTILVLSKLVYHLIHCLVYRPFLPIDLAELAGTAQHQSWQIEATNICFLHANAIAELVELGKQTASIELPAFVGYCICTAATVHIHGAHYKNGSEDSIGVLSSSAGFVSREMQQLNELSFAWANVQHQRDTLQRVYNAHTELVKGLAENSMRFTPTFNLEDFFDRYSTVTQLGSRPFSFDAANLNLSDVAGFATDTYTGTGSYGTGAPERPSLKRKSTMGHERRRHDLGSITPANAMGGSPLTSGLPTPGVHPQHFSFSVDPSHSSILHTPNSLPPHTERMHSNVGPLLRRRRDSIDDTEITATSTGYGATHHHQQAQQLEVMTAPSFSPSYHYATPSPSGDNECGLGVATSYDPMFGAIAPNTFTSPSPWHGEEDHRKQHSVLPSPEERSHTSNTAVGAGEEKDPFLSLLEQLAENEHTIGQGKEIDFFLTGTQG
ncbi:hypothetical protein GGR52DRAFT_115334 [Hypoxylon sp. FL1284]|nr:hypothetical protein GGR52DRAFT_115334 [Hypoxylon sp. FL1284]